MLIRGWTGVDIADFDAIPGVQLEWPDKDDFMRFFCFITPMEGLYKDARYEWEIVVPSAYPHSPPKCLLKTLPVSCTFGGYWREQD